MFYWKCSFANEIIQKYSFGGGCVNDTLIHLSNSRLPFGGVGHSGSGAYGKFSFDTFHIKKNIIKKSNVRFTVTLCLQRQTNIDKKLLKWT
jgi:aldehyde dehydrogenase (NAD+)